MNTYNDNLHNSVVASLNEQEIALQSITAKFNAAEDTLSYRQGSRVNTYEDLQLATNVQTFYQEAKEKVVEDNNASINLMDAVDQSKSYIDKTVSNTSAAAANVQIATNAITKLTSDVGSIFSIVNAANFESEIYTLGLRCKERMGETAFNAEAASQKSMEATSSVSNVPIGDLKKRADQANASIQELQGAINAEFTKANEKVKTDSSKLDTAVNNEKKAEGQLFVAQREYNSTAISYNITNMELNLNLNVITPEVNVQDQDATMKVSFSDYESPFPDPSEAIPKDPAVYQKDSRYFPVEEYNIFVVKYRNKSTFSISNAEEITNQYPIPPLSSSSDDDKSSKQYDVRYATKIPDRANYGSEATIPLVIKDLTLLLDKDFKDKTDPSKSTAFDPSENNPNCLQLDTDGDPIELGAQYVVFVRAVFSSKYKRAISNFDDYMTGASYNFKLQVDIPEAKGWNVGNEDDKSDNADNASAAVDSKEVGAPYVSFAASNEVVVKELEQLGVSLSDVDDKPVDYRCIFLPVLKENVDDPLIVHSMVTDEVVVGMGIDKKQQESQQKVTESDTLEDTNSRVVSLGSPFIDKDRDRIKEFQDEIKELEGIIEKKKGQEGKLNAKLDPLQKSMTKVEGLIKKYKDNGDKDKEAAEEKKKKELQKELTPLTNQLKTQEAEIADFKSDIENKTKAIEKLESDIENRQSAKNKLDNPADLGFLFNEKIASKIPASNYTLAQLLLKGESADESLENSEAGSKDESFLNYGVTVGPETTDNFGNRLIAGNTYVPAILAVFDPGNINKDKFKGALAMSDQTFEYVESN